MVARGQKVDSLPFDRVDQAVFLVGGKNDRWAADRFTFGVAANPEPGTLALVGLGALGLGWIVRRRRRGLPLST